MSPLVKTIVKSVVFVGVASLIGYAVDKFFPLKNKAGQVMAVNPTGPDLNVKRIGILGLIIGAGAVAAGFLGKMLKIPFLKN